MGVSGYYLVSGYYPVIIFPDRYPVDYHPGLSGIRQNSIRHIPIN